MTRVTAIIVIAFVAWLGAASSAAGQSRMSACGTLGAFAAPTAQRPVGAVSINAGGQLREFSVAGPGTVDPPNIEAIGTALNPVRARFDGAQGSDGVVTSWSLRQVPSCDAGPKTLPSTSSATDAGARLRAAAGVGLAMVGVVMLRASVVARRRRRSADTEPS